MKKLLYILLFVPVALFGQNSNPLFFSEYAHSGSNRYLEVYNTGSDTLSLADYALASVSNTPSVIGEYEFWHSFDSAATIAPGDVYVVAHPNSDSTILSHADETNHYLSNGDDGWALAMGAEGSHVYVDWVGDFNGDPGSYWNVCEGNTVNQTLVRKCNVGMGANWSISSSMETCQWNVLPTNTWDNLGFHSDCYANGCTDSLASNYDEGAENNDGTCIYPGCTNPAYAEYNNLANTDDGSCQILFSVAYAEVVEDNANLNNTIDEATTSLSSLQQALDTWNTTIDLSVGWNMFGYGCPSSINLADGLSNHTETIIITKDNSGNVYMPEFGFNGIGAFIPGFGYQIKLTEAIEGFSLCDWYVNDIPEDNIVSLQEDNASLQEEVDFMSTYFGCIDELACNYDETILLSDGSCEYAEPGFHCDGSQIQIGDFYGGGIIFYLDETGQHGLIASTENSSVGSILWGGPGDTLFNGYEWGCSGVEVDGADGIIIGSGYQNTIDIVNQECVTGGITAAEAAMEYNYSGYHDWYLPSKDELYEMYIRIGYGANENIGNFDYDWYWSSTENSYDKSWIVNFQTTFVHVNDKLNIGMVRPIRSF